MLCISLKRSRLLVGTLVGAHAAAGATLLPIALAMEVKLALTALILASLTQALARYALLRLPTALVAFEITEQQTASVQFRNGRWHEARVLGTTYVSPWLTVVNFRLAERRLARHAVIVPDNVDREDYRRLRVILRWGRPQVEGETDVKRSAARVAS